MISTGALLFSPLLELWVLLAHLVLPARELDGYVRDAKDKPLRYRLNGIPVLVTTVAAWAALCRLGILPWDYLYQHSWTTCTSASLVGLLVTLSLVLTGPVQTPSLATDLFLGRTLNPRAVVAGRVLDVKMYLYLIGAVHLELNVLSYTAAHYLSPGTTPHPNPGVALAAALLSWFVLEYLFYENVHLYTYDLFAERLGLKLAWGCLCFYPFFYALPLLAVVGLPTPEPRHGMAYHASAAVVFFVGWALSRGANLQKFRFKQVQAHAQNPRKETADGSDTKAAGVVVRSADGKKELFCGGLWGRARHVNYLGEILEAVGIALAVGHPTTALLPWLYPLYYVGLLVTRERDDDVRCREKYGALWEEYCRRVPWRIIPYVY